MNVERIVHLVAGMMVLLSLMLANLHHPDWLWLTAFVGLNLAQSGITSFCRLCNLFSVNFCWRGHDAGVTG